MARKSKLRMMMQEPLPPISHQKRLTYRITQEEAIAVYKVINKEIFDNALNMPELVVKSHRRKYWGMCHGDYEKIKNRRTLCWIELMDKWYCKQWFITILAHEAMHQYQWDINGAEREKAGKERLMSHGPSFFKFKTKFAEHGILLKKWHRRNSWFKYQEFK